MVYFLQKIVSSLVGWFSRQSIPLISKAVVAWYIKHYKVDLAQVVIPEAGFRSLRELFLRELRPGVRPLADGFVSPVDGTLRDTQVVSHDAAIQVKGKNYSISELIGHTQLNQSSKTVINLYLSPKDYHHVHLPIDCTVVEIKVLGAARYPVNDAALFSVERLMVKNVRAVVTLQGSIGLFYLVMVAALNVSSIELAPSVQIGANFKKGDRLGAFALGSTVILVLPGAHSVKVGDGASVVLGTQLI